MKVDIREAIASPTWKSLFLERLGAIPGIEELLSASRPPDTVAYRADAMKLAHAASSLMSDYPKAELMAARQHYNAFHLAEFWKAVRKMLDDGIGQGFIYETFPLARVTLNPGTKQIMLAASNANQFAEVFIDFNLDTMTVIASEMTIPENSPPLPRQIVGSLLGKLVLLKLEYIDSLTVYYNLYLSQQRAQKSPIWDAYSIHVFLDIFLYFDGDRPQFRSHFDAIFFNDNLPELKAYIEYHHSAGPPLSSRTCGISCPARQRMV